MTYVVSDVRASYGNCAAEYPTSAISEGGSQYVIGTDTYIGCGTCIATCPTGAISEDRLSIT